LASRASIAPFPPIPDNSGPEQLFHYTEAQGLLGIIESRSVWASDIRSLNDDEEFFFGLELALDQIIRLADPTLGSPAKERSEWLLERLRNEINESVRIQAFVTSFSAQSDLLSQWRAYCPGGGYALGMSTSALKRLAESQGYLLERCVYEPEEQRKKVAGVVTKVAQQWIQTGDEVPLIPNNHHGYAVLEKLVDVLSRILPFLKHPSFEEEQEWRLVKLLPGLSVLTKDLPLLKFRDGNHHVVPYLTFDLAAALSGDPPCSIVIGPALRQEEQRRALQLLERARLHALGMIHRSTSPYRGRSR
jgi:hypothetical protein